MKGRSRVYLKVLNQIASRGRFTANKKPLATILNSRNVGYLAVVVYGRTGAEADNGIACRCAGSRSGDDFEFVLSLARCQGGQ